MEIVRGQRAKYDFDCNLQQEESLKKQTRFGNLEMTRCMSHFMACGFVRQSADAEGTSDRENEITPETK